MPDRSQEYDVGILGAGVVGCAIAYALARRKVAPAVLDTDGAGSGTSGATAAGVWVHSKTPSPYARLSLRSAEQYPALQEEIGPIEYLRTGGIRPALSEAEALAGMELARQQAEAGLDVRWLSREDVLRREPALSPEILGATYSPHDGCVNPFLLIRRLVSAARRLGATFLLSRGHVAVYPLSSGFRLKAGADEVYVERLVLATGPWVRTVGRDVGVTVPVSLVRGHLLVTEKLPPLLRHNIAAARQLVTGEVLFGQTWEEAGLERMTTLEMIRRVARDGVRLIPALGAARLIRAFVGIRPMPFDGLPILGPAGDLDGLYVAATHSGITLAPLIGEAMADLLVRGRFPGDLDAWSSTRMGVPAGGGGITARQDSPKSP